MLLEKRLLRQDLQAVRWAAARAMSVLRAGLGLSLAYVLSE